MVELPTDARRWTMSERVTHKHLLRFLVVALCGLLQIAIALAQTAIPKLVAGINDPQHLLNENQAANLGRKIAAFEQGKDLRVVVLIVRDIGRENLIQYSARALQALPSASGSKGIVLLAVIADRERAWFEERNTNLELATAQRIVFETIVPRFKAGHDIAGGIDAGLDQLISVLSGNPLPASLERTDATDSLAYRRDRFRYRHQDTSGSGYVREMIYFLIGVALGLGLRRFTGRWPAALLAASVAGFGSWLQYGFIVPYSAGAFVVVFFGWKHWLGWRDGSTGGK